MIDLWNSSTSKYLKDLVIYFSNLEQKPFYEGVSKMFNKDDSTWSRSQDALLLGFQTTCRERIAKLLKVEDLATEASKEFIPRHEEKVASVMADINNRIATDIQDLKDTFEYRLFSSDNPTLLQRIFNFFNSNERKYSFVPESIEVEKRTFAIYEGLLETTISFKVKASAWKGYHKRIGYRRGYIREEETIINRCFYIKTQARRGRTAYIAYDKYSASLLPDKVLHVVKDAILIGMTDIQVAVPMVEPAQKDPIIVGFVDEQMFLITWFGYDLNKHTSYNL